MEQHFVHAIWFFLGFFIALMVVVLVMASGDDPPPDDDLDEWNDPDGPLQAWLKENTIVQPFEANLLKDSLDA